MDSSVLYNEFDPFAAEWLRELGDANIIPRGNVNERSIKELLPSDLAGRRTFHAFAGVGGWPLALRLAGWPDDRPVWTGSCPCQPYSAAGRGEGDADPRNLWPAFFGLIRECRPECIFGEQVESAIGHGWLDGISADLEREGYAVGSVVLGAHSVGSPHIRQRLFWVAYTSDPKCGRWVQPEGECRASLHTPDGGGADGLAHDEGEGWPRVEPKCPASERERTRAGSDCTVGRMAHTVSERLRVPGCGASGTEESGVQGTDGEREWVRPDSGPSRAALADSWSDFRVIPCRDGKQRRISAQPGDEPLAHGIPARNSDPRMGPLLAELEGLGFSPRAAKKALRNARRNRVGRLKGYGNAIIVEAAAEFIRAAM